MPSADETLHSERALRFAVLATAPWLYLLLVRDRLSTHNRQQAVSGEHYILYLARPEGFEPPTIRFEVCRSIR